MALLGYSRDQRLSLNHAECPLLVLNVLRELLPRSKHVNSKHSTLSTKIFFVFASCPNLIVVDDIVRRADYN